LLTGTLIAVTITLAILAHFVAAITIHRMLSLFVVAQGRGHVVALSATSCQQPPAFVAPVAGYAFKLKESISGGARGAHRRACQISFIVGWAVHSR
jgi:hypothetical protein